MAITSSKSSEKAHQLLARLRTTKPKTPSQLHAYIHAFLGMYIPTQAICPDHQSPMSYLANSFLDQSTTADSIIWANRGGGKTQLGAIATLLETIFLPRCQVRILGGSEEQSLRMYEHLQTFLYQGYTDHLNSSLTKRGYSLKNHSNVQVLTQSDRSVRGHHVQRLRCDEIELFDPDVWQGAQFVTHSKNNIPAKLEIFSTMHRPYGLMHDLITQAPQRNMTTYRWCLWEVIQQCTDRSCSQCPLWNDCRGRAQQSDGYFPIDDAIAIKQRSSQNAWLCEMLCQKPHLDNLVFPEFAYHLHIDTIEYNPNWPLYRSIDFGYTNPLACLFIQVNPINNTVFIIDEHLKARTLLSEQARLIIKKHPHPVQASYCDPAGKQHNEITGTNLVQEMYNAGIPLQYRSSRILDGIEKIRAHLAPASGPAKITISPKCTNLIRAFESFRHKKNPDGSLSEIPDKDGTHDHIIDALRYFFINRFPTQTPIKTQKY